MQEGNLIIKPISAKLTHDTSSFGSMDPYVIVSQGGRSHTSSVAKKMGKYPNWTDKDAFPFRVTSDTVFRVVVMDKDTLSADDFVADGNLVINPSQQGKSTQTVSLSYKGKPAGQILFELEFTADAQPQNQPQFLQSQNLSSPYNSNMMYQNSMQCMQPSTQNNSVMTSMNMNNMNSNLMNSNVIPIQQGSMMQPPMMQSNMMMQQPNMMMQQPNMMPQDMMQQQQMMMQQQQMMMQQQMMQSNPNMMQQQMMQSNPNMMQMPPPQ